MDPTTWSRATRPAPLLEALGARADERRLRLFAVACCRRIWDLFPEGVCREAVEVSERYADGLATADDLLDAFAGANLFLHRWTHQWGKRDHWNRCTAIMAGKITLPGMHTSTIAEMTESISEAIKLYPYRWDSWFGWGKEPRMQAALL